ncbi:MAG TPA: glycosyltransferase family 2 protein [Anaeromyxobacter sp.]|nr:glycosyltransferase family 2 protein [Anaeromyxobacter sp.]
MAERRISLCLIARNEEGMLPGCLASVSGAVDEIVLVDTGSTDRTREIAREAGALVLERPWDDDFAAPRNLAVERASGGFILQLDADERLAPGAARAIRAGAGADGFDVGFLRLHNASRVDAPVDRVLSGQLRWGEPALLPRLLRHTPDLRYEGVIHESVTDWAVARGSRFGRIDGDIVHLGYVESVHAGRGKKARNLAMLWRRVEQEPSSVVPLAYLAAELVGAREWEAAAEVAERGFALLPSQPAHRPVRRLLVSRAVAAMHRNELAKVHESVNQAEAREGPNPDYDHLRGCAWESEARALPPAHPRRRQLLGQAVEAYRRSLEAVRRGGFVQVMVAGEAEALTRLGNALLLRGEFAEAGAALAEARRGGGGEGLRLAEAEARMGAKDPAGALALLEPLLEQGQDPAAWAAAARAALALGSQRDAAVFLARARMLKIRSSAEG